ncbi:hypothetical protein D8674_031058 [Pyrus ussuriensis x Pyrus communis]|uniref:Uncharacterized protein n=1 Tax=Pyrus ussuriensis x Pyrus communis TaxID=2448454 RepID=A0A5N5EXE4_9ROSA|nr:hypothetical protein D8674_031058 [Pyrus ussuriensis x Pyrus communis]
MARIGLGLVWAMERVVRTSRGTGQPAWPAAWVIWPAATITAVDWVSCLNLLWQLLQFGPLALGGDGNGSKGYSLWPRGGCYIIVVVITALRNGGASVAVVLNLEDSLCEATSSSPVSNPNP